MICGVIDHRLHDFLSKVFKSKKVNKAPGIILVSCPLIIAPLCLSLSLSSPSFGFISNTIRLWHISPITLIGGINQTPYFLFLEEVFFIKIFLPCFDNINRISKYSSCHSSNHSTKCIIQN